MIALCMKVITVQMHTLLSIWAKLGAAPALAAATDAQLLATQLPVYPHVAVYDCAYGVQSVTFATRLRVSCVRWILISQLACDGAGDLLAGSRQGYSLGSASSPATFHALVEDIMSNVDIADSGAVD